MIWPDLSQGRIQDLLDHPAEWMEWPISGDNITCRRDDSLLSLVDWAALGEDPEDAIQIARGPGALALAARFRRRWLDDRSIIKEPSTQGGDHGTETSRAVNVQVQRGPASGL